jgi:hypothetical protein
MALPQELVVVRQIRHYMLEARRPAAGRADHRGGRRGRGLLNVQEPANFFERRVSAYQVTLPGTVTFTEDF